MDASSTSISTPTSVMARIRRSLGNRFRGRTEIQGNPDQARDGREPCDQDALEESLTAVADDIATAFRPDGAMVRRVVERITPSPGRWDVPYEVEPDLDLPAWTWLRDNAPEWLLPNAGLVEPDSVIAVRSNPGFVDALLLGLSSQAVAELRWRGVPLVAGAMPMRTFWQGNPTMTIRKHASTSVRRAAVAR